MKEERQETDSGGGHWRFEADGGKETNRIGDREKRRWLKETKGKRENRQFIPPWRKKLHMQRWLSYWADAVCSPDTSSARHVVRGDVETDLQLYVLNAECFCSSGDVYRSWRCRKNSYNNQSLDSFSGVLTGSHDDIVAGIINEYFYYELSSVSLTAMLLLQQQWVWQILLTTTVLLKSTPCLLFLDFFVAT